MESKDLIQYSPSKPKPILQSGLLLPVISSFLGVALVALWLWLTLSSLEIIRDNFVMITVKMTGVGSRGVLLAIRESNATSTIRASPDRVSGYAAGFSFVFVPFGNGLGIIRVRFPIQVIPLLGPTSAAVSGGLVWRYWLRERRTALS